MGVLKQPKKRQKAKAEENFRRRMANSSTKGGEVYISAKMTKMNGKK